MESPGFAQSPPVTAFAVPSGIILWVLLQLSSFNIGSRTSFQPPAVVSRNNRIMDRKKVSKFVISSRKLVCRIFPNCVIPNMAYINMTRNNSIPMLNKAGREIIMAKSSFLMPLAAFMRRNTRPMRKTRTTRSKVGVMKISSKISSNTIPGNIIDEKIGFCLNSKDMQHVC